MDGWINGCGGIDWQTKRQRKIYNYKYNDRLIALQIDLQIDRQREIEKQLNR